MGRFRQSLRIAAGILKDSGKQPLRSPLHRHLSTAVVEWLEERRLLSGSTSVAASELSTNPWSNIQAVPLAQPYLGEAPTVVTAASATPAPVTGTLTTLSVLGDDDDGNSTPTYSWATTGTPPAVVLFSSNGTNAAKTTTASFSQAGNYSFEVTITNEEGSTVASDVSVMVTQTATSVSVVSADTTIAAGETAQLTAVELDQFGNAMASQPVFNWSLTSGTGSVNSTGLYSATASAGSAIVTASVSGVGSQSQALTVVAPLVWYTANASTGTTTLVDSSGNNQTAQLNGSTVFEAGLNGNALNLYGGYAKLPAGIVSTLNNFTISAWVNLASLSSGAPIFDFGTGTNSYLYLTPDADSTGNLTFGITNSGITNEQQVVGPAISAGAWTHFAVTLAGTTATVYVNGQPVASGTVTLTPASLGSTNQNFIGQSQFSNDSTLLGSVDDFRVYAAALSANQLQQIASISAPTRLTDTDIGGPAYPGTAFYDAGTGVWTVSGGGADIFSNYDQFNFASTPLSGDLVLSAEVTAVGNTSAYTKTGLMIRSSLDPDSVEASVVMTPGDGVEFEYRSATNQSTAVSVWTGINGPVWLKLDRYGSTVSAYLSNDDETWYEVGSPVSLPLGDSVFAGLAVSAHDNSALSTSTFSGVSVAENAPPTIVDPAVAEPSTVAGYSTELSVLGADDDGEENLTYTWAAAGTPPAPVTFSVDGVNNADVTQASFSASGTYNLTATITDAGGYTVQSSIAVTVTIPPAVPVGVQAHWNGSSVSVSWQPVTGASSYSIYRATAIGGEGSAALVTGVTSDIYVDSEVTTGTQYYYEVVAVGSAGVSGRSFETAAMTASFTTPIITEFMASNSVTLADADGDYPNWLQLYNPTASTVTLTGDYLTDSTKTLTKWQFPTATLAPGAFLVVFCDSENDTDSAGAFHTSFSISASSGYLALVASNATTILSSYTYTQQVTDVSFGIAMAQANTASGVITSYGGVGFLNPAPGAISGPVIATAIAAEPTFNYPDGFYSSTLHLTIASATAGASIYYTTDSTSPSVTNGTLYTGPITVTGETEIRAIAIAPNYLASPAAAASYIYLSQVLTQAANGQAPAGWPVDWGFSSVDYGMNPEVVNDPAYSSEIEQDLLDIPSVSLNLSLEDLFDPATGIYSESQISQGWVRPGSIELINPSGPVGFQADAGISIKGDFSALQPNGKHGFDIEFATKYGQSALDYPVFGADAAQSFQEIQLRTDQNNSWSFSEPQNFTATRDEFTSALLAATGQAAEHNKVCFLYLDGMFWGLYDIIEKPDADFAASYFGGSASDYDAIKATNLVQSDSPSDFGIEAVDGTLTAWDDLYTDISTLDLSTIANFEMIQGNNPDGTPNAAYPDLLDVNNLINYMLVDFYTGNIDSPYESYGPNNFDAIRPTDGSFGFRFIATDSEQTTLSLYDNVVYDLPTSVASAADGNPAYYFSALEANSEFRTMVSDAIQKDFFNGGPMSVPATTALFTSLEQNVADPVVLESARWGDATRPGQPYTRDNDWQPLVDSLLSGYFPDRTAYVLNQLSAAGLFSLSPAAPAFSQYGGTIAAGYKLSMSNPNNSSGSIYYTLDGSDPVNASGTLASTAILYTGPITLETTTEVKAVAGAGSAWSAAVDETFDAPITSLRVTELNYDPATPAGGTYTNDDDEFIELQNFGSFAINLDDASFTNGITYTFGDVTLSPGQVGVLVNDAAAFAALYGSSPYVLGAYGPTGTSFSSKGEEVTLTDATDATVFDFTYSPTWYPSTAGQGSTLEVVSPTTNPNLSLAASWRASLQSGGTPGVDNSIPTGAPTGLTASLSSGQAALAWSTVAGAATYNVYRGTSAGNEGTTPIATGLSTASYLDTTVVGGLTYYYTVTAVDPGGISAAGNEAMITIPQVPAAPAIVSQPVSEIVISGNTATFTAAASGYPAPTVQWYLSNNSGETWTTISGATSATYSFVVANAGLDRNQYEAVFNNAQGSITSNPATLTVIAAPITAWDFDTSDKTGKAISTKGTNTAPDPSTGLGSAGSIGMALVSGPDDSGITDDPGSSDGSASTQQAWKIVGNNGWSSTAAIGAQGAQFMVSTVGYYSIALQFDLDITTQGEGNLAVEYTLNGGTTWLLAPSLNANGDAGISVKTNTTSTNTVMGEYFNAFNSTGTEVWYNRLTVDFSGVTGAANNPNFGVRLVNASTGADCVNLAGNALNNTSGNWRIDEVDIDGASTANVNWTGAADGVNWNVPGNWSDDLVPFSTVNVTIGSGFNVQVSAGTYAVKSIISSSPIEIESGATMHLDGAATFTGGLTLDAGSSLLVAPGRVLLVVNGFNLVSSATLDLANNAMVIENSSLSTITGELASGYNSGAWNGAGIFSSSAAANTAHLTALGVILNNDGTGLPLYGTGNPLGLFNGFSPSLNDILIKYTYYGDANLDGKVDGSDYSLLDNGVLNQLSGWYSGSFNYGSTLDGSDYTLIDNAYNTQGASLAAEVASPALSQLETDSTTTPGKKRNHVGRGTFAANIFQTKKPITISESAGETLEYQLQKKDLLDTLSASGQN